MEEPIKLDNVEMDLVRKGYKFVTQKTLPEEVEPSEQKKIYINIKPLYNSMRYVGFSEDTIIRIRFIGGEYIANIFSKD